MFFDSLSQPTFLLLGELNHIAVKVIIWKVPVIIVILDILSQPITQKQNEPKYHHIILSAN